MKKHHFFAFLSRMKFISRWGLMRNSFPENIQEHCLQVAVIAHGLGMVRNTYFNGNINVDKLAVMAMYHDSNEIITGDMPTPIKYYNNKISSAYKDIENISKEKILAFLPKELRKNYEEYFFIEEKEYKDLVKIADRIAAFIKCIEEEKTGNREFKVAKESILKTIKSNELPEVKFFMENFIPSFSLSLDELE